MKEILISIQPKWIAKILNGEKTIEIRKTMPKCELPVKVYIYCTKQKPFLKDFKNYNDKHEPNTDRFILFNSQTNNNKTLNGKVVAEFTLNKVKEHKFNYIFENPETYEQELTYNFNIKEMKDIGFENSWEFDDFLLTYGKGKTLYAWHIEDLIIYDKPKELSEFTVPNPDVANLGSLYGSVDRSKYPLRLPLEKAPQSWCYVKNVKEY